MASIPSSAHIPDSNGPVRLMRPMTALGIFKETDRETYALSSVSEALLNNAALLGGFKFT